MNKLLLIIDPQIDFITGSLPVPGAAEAMDALASFIADHGGDYRDIAVTADCHPFNHCSFRSQDGPWPVHCVSDSVGAAIWQPIMDALSCYGDRVIILHKGECPSTEEYSIFKNKRSADRLRELITSHGLEQIDICGLAGDVCVADTIADGLKELPDVRVNVLRRFTPSIDGGERLDSLINQNDLSCDRL